MRKRVAALLGAICILAWVAPMLAKTETITGEVISVSCYFRDKTLIGQKGAVCALATVKWEGNPAGILTADGRVYQVAGGLAANNNAKIVEFLGQRVRMTGDVFERARAMVIAADAATVVK